MIKIFEDIASETRAKACAAAMEDGPAIIAKAPTGTVLPMKETPELRAAIEETDAILLLPVLVHLTGDESWLDRTAAHIRPWDAGGAAIPEDLAKALRDRLLDVLTSAQPNLAPVTEGALKRIMSTMVASPVTDEYVPLLIEQMGFEPAGRFAGHRHLPAPEGHQVAIIGAGLSGIAAAIKLAESGYSYQIFERSEDLGGVWWSNKYPGVGVDTPSHFYSYSFALNPDWPSYFSEGSVLMDYWRNTAAKYGVTDHIRFRTNVDSCLWEESSASWTVAYVDADGHRHDESFNSVICATGMFNNPADPDLPGLGDFGGATVHTARWDDAVDIRGKRVGIIGTGASAFQLGPVIAPDTAHLTVFQRTPPWIAIQPDGAYKRPTKESFRWALRHIPHLAQWMRFHTYWGASDGMHKLIVADPEWPVSDTSINAESQRWYEMLKGLLEQKLASRPDLIEKMTPQYPPMGKRMLQDSYWCEMVMRDDVDLVTDPIERVVENGIVTRDGRLHPLDVLVLATGFNMSGMLQHMRIEGRDGVTIRDLWGSEDPRAYLGTMVPGLPNFFLIGGPNAGASHGAGVNAYSEAQVNYILSCLDELCRSSGWSIEPTQDAHDAYNERLDTALRSTVWSHHRVNTYYCNSKGRNFVSCPWRIVDIWHLLRTPRSEDMMILGKAGFPQNEYASEAGG